MNSELRLRKIANGENLCSLPPVFRVEGSRRKRKRAHRRLHERPQGGLRRARQTHVPLGLRLVGLAAAATRAEAEHLTAQLRLGEARVAQNVLDRRLHDTRAQTIHEISNSL